MVFSSEAVKREGIGSETGGIGSETGGIGSKTGVIASSLAAPIIGHIVTPLLDVAANELAITPVFDPIPPVSDPIPPVSDPIPPVSDPISSLYLQPGVDLVDYLHINLSEYSEKERQIIKAIVKLIIKYESPSTSLAIKEEILEIIARLTNKQYLLYERAADIYYLRM